jgi:hypothetical protein
MDWKDYEATVKNIYEILGKNSGVKIEGYGNNCKLKGHSGIFHQIDVLTSHSDGVHIYKTAIECKYHDRKIDKDTVMKIADIVKDCNLDKAVVVSKLGFTPDATSYANYNNIDLIELREPMDSDWEGRIKNITINLEILIPEILKFTVIPAHNSTDQEQLMLVNTSEYYFKFRDTNKITIKQLIDEFYSNELTIPDEIIEKKTEFPAGTKLIFEEGNLNYEVTGVIIKGRLNRSSEVIQIRGENYVAMIMKTVFGGKRFVISQNGEIRETSS